MFVAGGVLTENAIITSTIFIAIICSILLGSWLSRKTTVQIRMLERGVREIALGNLDFRMTCDSGDELSVLCDAFNSMAIELKSSKQQVEDQISKLQESETRFRLAARATHDMIWEFDRTTMTVKADVTHWNHFGYSLAEVEPMNEFWRSIIHPDDSKRVSLALESAFASCQDSFSTEYRIKNKDGSYSDIADRAFIVYDENKNPKCVVGALADITERKKAEEQLRRSEVRFRSLVERSSDITSIYDETGKVLYMTPSISQLGYSTSEIEGKRVLDLVHPDDADKLLAMLETILRLPEVPYFVQLRFKDKNGAWHDTESVVSNQLSVPEVRGLVVNSRDVTEKKRLEAQFLRAQRMESIGILAGGIAHDLNNILSPIMLAVDLLREQHPNLKSQKTINSIETSVKRGADLIRQVLSFARGVEGKHTLIQPRHLVSEIDRIVRETFPKSIDITVDVPRNLWNVSGDATQLHQIMMNLCVNAGDAMPDGGQLTITGQNLMLSSDDQKELPTAEPGPYVVLTISDTGIGIPENIRERIFEPFFTTKEPGKGTGLGLSTVSTILKNHGGFIHVNSEVGRGTSFKIYIPAQTVAEVVPEQDNGNGRYAGNGELVLIVDDEVAIREFMKVTLSTFGYKTLVAPDGTQAVQVFGKSRKKIDLVITDVMMPCMDGAGTIDVLRRLDPEVKILAVSGSVESEKAIESRKVNRFLSKPFASGSLLKAVHDALSET